jgi:hypothetical protein
MKHLYAGASWVRGPLGKMAIANTACGLRKAFVFGRVPRDVVEALGAVTCPQCLKIEAALAQQGNKAQ